MKLYIAGLNYAVTENDLKTIFTKFGRVTFAKVIRDKNNKSKGFAFIGLDTDSAGGEAIKQYNGSLYAGRTITVAPGVDRK